VNFLSRFYGPNVWFGDINSICDVPRQLKKLHLTVALPPQVTPIQKLNEKLRAFYQSDSNTPIFKLIFKHYFRVGGTIQDVSQYREMVKWGSDVPGESQYPNEDSGWMESYVASVYDVSLTALEEYLEKMTCLEDMLTMPAIIMRAPLEPHKTADYITDEDVVKTKQLSSITIHSGSENSAAGTKKTDSPKDQVKGATPGAPRQQKRRDDKRAPDGKTDARPRTGKRGKVPAGNRKPPATKVASGVK